MDRSYQQLDTLIHQPARLSIMAALASAEEVEFAALKSAINISDSLLSRYIGMLEDAKYIKVRKGFVSKRARTWLSLTSTGREAFEQHIKLLNQIVNQPPNNNGRGDRT